MKVILYFIGMRPLGGMRRFDWTPARGILGSIIYLVINFRNFGLGATRNPSRLLAKQTLVLTPKGRQGPNAPTAIFMTH